MESTHTVNASDEGSLELLQDSLNEAQMTVRAYDTKAQIVGVGYIFALGIVVQIGDLLPDHNGNPLALVLLSWIIVIFPVFHFGHVLYPTRKTAPKLSHDLDAKLQRVLYVDTERFTSPDGLRSSVEKCDPIDEYCFELLKTSKLRELKRRRFLRGLMSTVVAFLILFLSHVGRSFL
ncbi:MAG: hypothetical protein AAFO77_11145 [Pseudomonadota bacterium]